MFGPLLEVEISKKCTPLWNEEHFQVKMLKAPHAGTTFGSWDAEKVHAVAARSTCPSQKFKNWQVRSTFWRSDVVLRGRRKGLWTLPKSPKRAGFVAVSTTTTNTIHYATLHSSALHYSTFNSITLQLQYITLRYITLRYITLRYITLRYTQLHYATLHLQLRPQPQLRYLTDYTTLHYVTLDPTITPLQYNCKYITAHHNYNSTTLQLQLQLHCAKLHPAVVGEVTTATIATTPKKKHNSNHLSVHQWICSAIRDSQQPTSAIGFLFWNFRHRLVRYYWYGYAWTSQLHTGERTKNMCMASTPDFHMGLTPKRPPLEPPIACWDKLRVFPPGFCGSFKAKKSLHTACPSVARTHKSKHCASLIWGIGLHELKELQGFLT